MLIIWLQALHKPVCLLYLGRRLICKIILQMPRAFCDKRLHYGRKIAGSICRDSGQLSLDFCLYLKTASFPVIMGCSKFRKRGMPALCGFSALSVTDSVASTCTHQAPPGFGKPYSLYCCSYQALLTILLLLSNPAQVQQTRFEPKPQFCKSGAISQD